MHKLAGIKTSIIRCPSYRSEKRSRLLNDAVEEEGASSTVALLPIKSMVRQGMVLLIVATNR